MKKASEPCRFDGLDLSGGGLSKDLGFRVCRVWGRDSYGRGRLTNAFLDKTTFPYLAAVGHDMNRRPKT